MARGSVLLLITLLVLASSAHGQTCTTDDSCQYYIQGSKCDNSECKCMDGTVLSSDETLCLDPVNGYGDTCLETVQCAETLKSGGICSDGVCTCKDGFHYLIGRCWRSVPIGGSCTSDEQCYGAYDFIGFQCNAGVCQCREQYYERGGGCRRMSENEGDCIVDMDCHCDGGKCNSRKCNCSSSVRSFEIKSSVKVQASKATSTKESPCQPGNFPVDETCHPELGTDCKDQGDNFCSDGIDYALCLDNRVCACPSLLRNGTPDNRSCLKATLAINQQCASNGQCSAFGENSFCKDSLCACTDDSHYDEVASLCRKSKNVGDACQEDGDCVTTSAGNVACLANVCTCEPGSHQADGNKDCRPDSSHVGETCIENSDCMFPNAECNTEKRECQCAQNFFPDTESLCKNGVGSTCVSADNCRHIAYSDCVNSTCQCNDNYVSATNFETCLKVSEYGEECQQDDQCNPVMGDLKVCKEGKCACVEGSQYLSSKCFIIKQLGESCKARAECVPEGGELDAYMCQNAICACQYGYQRDGNKCVKQ